MSEPPLIRRVQPWLGTLVEISVCPDFSGCVDAAFGAISHVHQRMSFHEPTSDLAQLRTSLPGVAVRIDPETVVVLKLALELYTSSEGLFDVTIGRALVESGFLPIDQSLNLAHFAGTMVDIDIVNDRHVVLHKPALIDLGGIAKGYAVDRAVEILVAAHVPYGIVNAGGDLRVFGDYDMPISIRQANGQLSAPIMLKTAALASSENRTSRRLRANGKGWSKGWGLKTPHIGHGYKAIKIDHTLSVIADQCVIADAATKIAMTNIKLANAILKKYNGHVLPNHSMPANHNA